MLLNFLDEVDVDENGRISATELSAAISKAGLSDDQLQAVFATTDREQIFSHIDADDNDTIDFAEILAFLESIGIDVTIKCMGWVIAQESTVYIQVGLHLAVGDILFGSHRYGLKKNRQ